MSRAGIVRKIGGELLLPELAKLIISYQDPALDVLETLLTVMKWKFDINSEIKPVLYMGPALAFRTTAVAQGATTAADYESITGSNFLMWEIGAQAEYKWKPKMNLLFDLRYSLGLGNISKVTGQTEKLKSIQFIIGTSIALN